MDNLNHQNSNFPRGLDSLYAMCILSLLLLIVPIYNYAQSKGTTKLYLYNPVFPNCCADTIITTRLYKAKNKFTDNKIFCMAKNNNKCAIDFKVEKRNWYIKSNNRWKLFYNDNLKGLNSALLKKQCLFIQMDTMLIIGNDSLYSFTAVNIEHENTSFTNVYYFHPDYGIILIKGHDGIFKRLDYVNPALKREYF